MALASVFKNGTVKIILTVALTLMATGVFTYAWQGLHSYSQEEAGEKFVSKEAHDKDMSVIDDKLDTIIEQQKDNMKDIKELFRDQK